MLEFPCCCKSIRILYSFSYRISLWYPGWSWAQDLHAQHLEGPIFWGEFYCPSGMHDPPLQEDRTFTLRAVQHEAWFLFCTCPLAFLLSVPNRNSMRPSWRESSHQGRALRIPSLQTISQYEFRKSGYLHGWQSSGYWPTRLEQSSPHPHPLSSVLFLDTCIGERGSGEVRTWWQTFCVLCVYPLGLRSPFGRSSSRLQQLVFPVWWDT